MLLCFFRLVSGCVWLQFCATKGGLKSLFLSDLSENNALWDVRVNQNSKVTGDIDNLTKKSAKLRQAADSDEKSLYVHRYDQYFLTFKTLLRKYQWQPLLK